MRVVTLHTIELGGSARHAVFPHDSAKDSQGGQIHGSLLAMVDILIIHFS
jgi:hypothetical protein